MWTDDKKSVMNASETQMSGMDGGQYSAEIKPAMPASALVEASRRIDWRFLLPNPSLGDVAAVGPVADTLTESLKLFCASLTLLGMERAHEERSDSLFDVVVACDPSRAVVRRTATLIKPGGFLYLEARGLTSLLLSRRPARLDALRKNTLWRAEVYASVLRPIGFTDVQAHWHWPDFENCKMMIPLDNSAAIRHALDRGGRGLKARLRRGMGHILRWSGLLTWTVPCYSVLARRKDL